MPAQSSRSSAGRSGGNGRGRHFKAKPTPRTVTSAQAQPGYAPLGAQAQPKQRHQQRGTQTSRSGYARRGAQAQQPMQVITPPQATSGPQRRQDPYARSRRKRSAAPIILGIVVVAVALAGMAAGAYFLLNPATYPVTINGTEHTVSRGTTIAAVLEEGLASPVAGNLLAIDGEVIAQGGGDPFSATINGEQTTDPATVLPANAEVEIGNGADVTETFTTAEEVIAHGQKQVDVEMGSYWNGSLHVYVKGEDGLRTTKTGDVSGKVISEDTKPAVDSGYTIYTADVGEDKVVALTFDDGPGWSSTDEILDILEENGAKATFFTVGEQVAESASQVKRAHDLGCQICTHTWDHANGSGQGVNLTYMSAEEQIAEVQRGYEAIKSVLGEEPAHIMRAPGGNFYGDIISTLEPYVDAEIGWDVDTEDWRRPGSDAIYEMIMSVRPGQVVLMHDGGGDRSQTVEAVRQAVPALISQGYRLVTVNDLLAYGVPADA